MSVSITSVEMLLLGTTRPETWIMKNVGTNISALTNRLKKPTEIKLLLQTFKAACKLFSGKRLIASILSGKA
ncbi:hypothetical protein D3C76_1606210 [compost metagenome]